MNKIINWLVVSSQDPTKTSLTVKGFCATALSFIVPVLAVLGYQTIGGNLNTLSVEIVSFVQGFFTLVSAVIALYGLARKIYNTIKNINIPPSVPPTATI